MKTIWLINQYASTPERGLAGRHYYFAHELAKKGYRVKVIAASYSHIMREPKNLASDIEIENRGTFDFVWVRVNEYASSNSKRRILNWFAFAYQLLKLPKHLNERPDVILYSSAPLVGYLAALRLSKRLKAKIIFEVRDIWPLSVIQIGGYSPNHPFIRFLQWIEDKAYRTADFVVSNLKNSHDHMASRGLKRNKFKWIANGVSFDEVTQNIKLNNDAMASLPKDKFVIGYAGAFGNANALNYLLHSAKELINETDIAFVLVGAGKEKDNLQNFVTENQLTNVHFIEPIPKVEIQSMLKTFDVCYIGLTKDPLFRFGVSPNKLFDYLYSARPIIYAIDSGNYNPVKEVNAGIEVEPENAANITKAILELRSKSKNELNAIGMNGRKLVEEQYSYKYLTSELESVINCE